MSGTNTGTGRAITGTARAQLPRPQSGGAEKTSVELVYKVDGVAFKISHMRKEYENLTVGTKFVVQHVLIRDGAEVLHEQTYATRAPLSVRTLKNDTESARVEGYAAVALDGDLYISKTREGGGRKRTANVLEAYPLWIPREAIQSLTGEVIEYPKTAVVTVRRLTMFDKK